MVLRAVWALALLLGPAMAFDRLELARGWQLENAGSPVKLQNVSLPASVLPALHKAGVVGDPLWRYNERELRWAALDTWTFSLQFEAPRSLLWHAAVLLRCDGLDNVASVELNGSPVGTAINAHRPHSWDVTQLLAEGANRLVIRLDSAAAYAAAQRDAYPYPVPHTQQVGAVPGYNFIRKAASDFGWDWGPAFPIAGITGGVELVGYSTAVLTGLAVRQQHFTNASVAVEVDALLLLPPAAALRAAGVAEEQGQLLLELSSPEGGKSWRVEQAVSVGPAVQATACAAEQPADEALPGGAAAAVPQPVRRTLRVIVEQPQLWWPHDFGQQPLYLLQVTYTPAQQAIAAAAGSSSSAAPPAAEATSPAAETSRAGAEGGNATYAGSSSSSSSGSTLSRRIGLRRVELVTEALPGGSGETFFFRINGQPVYARGANVVPAHLFESEVTPARLRRLVADAKAVGMNMLRVWGGGRYMSDAFYDACDEAGLLVWQEAMFACAPYPADDAFLREAWLEVGHQVARLSSHPSIAIWGGNNENEASFGWFAETRANLPLYAVDFSRLFVDTIRQAVLRVDPAIPFVDTSPSNGLLSTAPYAKRWGDVSDPRFGDVHFYDYQSDALDPATYPAAKFVSEYGFMSLPSFAAYRRVTAPEDWNLSSPMTAYRMRHANGLEEVDAQMQRHFLSQLALQGAQQAQQAQRQAQPQQAQPQAPQLTRGEALAALAAGHDKLVSTFQTAEAERRDPLAATEAAAKELMLNASHSGSSSSSVAAAPVGSPAARAAPQAEQEQTQQAQQQAQQEPLEQRRFRAFTYLSQLQQGLAYQAAVHQWRRGKADRQARTMGVLYWQLNDVWAGPSWTSINADGSWRLTHHLAGEFFRPVLISGVKAADGDSIQVYLTNDLPVGVSGTLTVDAIPFAATHPDQVVPLLRLDSSFVAAYASRRAWAASIRSDVLPAVGGIPRAAGSSGGRQVVAAEGSADGSSSSTSGSGSSTRPAEAADVFLRLRFCPTGFQQQDVAEWATGPPPNPFASSSSGAAAAAAAGQPQLTLGNSAAPAAERAAAASDGGGSGSGSQASQPCSGSPVALPPGASEDQCVAARRLLQCSESLVFLTELKDARLAAANVSAWVVQDGSGDESSSGSSSGGSSSGGGSSGFTVALSSDAVALFVSLESEQQVGRFNASALLLLPWEPQTVHFLPVEEAGPEQQAINSNLAAQPAAEAELPAAEAGPPAAEAGPPAAEARQADDGMLHSAGPAAEAAGPASSDAASSADAPLVRIYSLQQEMAALGEAAAAQAMAGEAEAATSRGGRSRAGLLCAALVLSSVLLSTLF